MSLSEINKAYSDALREENYDKISELVSFLNNASPPFKKDAQSLYEQIEQELFERNRSIGNLDSKSFNLSITEWEEKQKNDKPVEEKKSLKEEEAQSFDQSFISFYNRHRKIFSELKDYFFFRLENGNTINPISVLIITCDISENHPSLTELKRVETILSVEKYTISQFLENQKTILATKKTYICLFSLTPNLNGIDDIIPDIEEVFQLFEKAYSLSIKNRDIEISDYHESEIDHDFSILQNNSNKIFNNKVLTYDAERLIKSFFEKNTAIIDYNILNPGASGSWVIEVQAINIRMSASKRYVIKVAKKINGQRGKLQIEMGNFNAYVKQVPTTQTIYAADYKDNETVEAIQYNYASRGSVKDAFSFAAILKDFFSDDPKSNFDLSLVMQGLVGCELFELGWNVPTPCKKSCEQLYKNYLKKENKILEAIDEVADDKVDTLKLKEYFNKLKSFQLESNEKICHGDLHSDNFFWDGERVTLIDFGFTEHHHAVVDHTFFETSIKLRHIPRYIPLKELLEYEKGFLDPKSFEPNFDLSFVRREKLKPLYKLINDIRVDSRKYFLNKESTIEYMISLFIITFRQSQYMDLNPLFAIRIADLLSKNITI